MKQQQISWRKHGYKCSVWYVHQGVMISTFNYNVFDFRQCLVQHIVAYIHVPNDFGIQGNVHLGYKGYLSLNMDIDNTFTAIVSCY